MATALQLMGASQLPSQEPATFVPAFRPRWSRSRPATIDAGAIPGRPTRAELVALAVAVLPEPDVR
eukprot:7425393-Alexandrium_andersonii.AAC.1